MVKRVNASKQRCETKQLKSLVCVCVCWCEPYLSGEPPLELLLGLLLLSLVLLCGRRSSRERVCYCQRKSASRIKAGPLVPNIPSRQWNSTAATSDFGPTYTSYVVYVLLYFIFMNLRLRMFLCSSSSVVGLWLSRLERKKKKKILFLLIESVKNRCRIKHWRWYQSFILTENKIHFMSRCFFFLFLSLFPSFLLRADGDSNIQSCRNRTWIFTVTWVRKHVDTSPLCSTSPSGTKKKKKLWFSLWIIYFPQRKKKNINRP